MIGMPPAGTYTIQTLPGSPQITAIRHADGHAQPKVSGSVTGSGSSRTLPARLLRLPPRLVAPNLASRQRVQGVHAAILRADIHHLLDHRR